MEERSCEATLLFLYNLTLSLSKREGTLEIVYYEL